MTDSHYVQVVIPPKIKYMSVGCCSDINRFLCSSPLRNNIKRNIYMTGSNVKGSWIVCCQNVTCVCLSWSETQIIVLAFNSVIEGCYKTLNITFLEHKGLWFKCQQRYGVVCFMVVWGHFVSLTCKQISFSVQTLSGETVTEEPNHGSS